MKAWKSGAGHGPMVWEELKLPSLGTHELRVRVRAAGVNPVDWKMRHGDMLGMLQRVLGPGGPLVVGVDFAGEVEAVGSGVQGLQVGDRVVGGTHFARRQFGSYATHVQVRADQVAKLPAHVDWAQAACLPVAGCTASIALHEVGRLTSRKDPRVLVLGASGGVGHVAVQLAHSAGAATVGVCSTRNTQFVSSLGAEAIDYSHDDWATRVAASGPFDIIIDGVGSSSYPVNRCFKWLKPGGVHVMVVPKASDIWRLVTPGPAHTVLAMATTARLEPLVAALAAKQLRIHLQAQLPMSQAEEAHRLSEGGKVVGKLVLVDDEELSATQS